MQTNSLDNPGIDPALDEFNRWPFSQRLANTIVNFNTHDGAPVIGIYAKWGYGKSTVLNYIKHALSRSGNSEKVILLDFNLWLLKNEESMLEEFFFELAKALDTSLSTNAQKFGALVKQYAFMVAAIPGGADYVEPLAEAGSALSRDSVSAKKQRITDMMRRSVRKVVVVIDDLDRLENNEVVAILKLVRLSANFPNIVYVLAFDDEIVAKAAETKYGVGAEAGRQFLEKIIQYPVTLPAIGQDRLVASVERQARTACESAGITLAEEDNRAFCAIVDMHLSRRLNTPRQVIRYANALHFALPMLKGEVDPYHQMVVEGLRLLYPELYRLVREDARSFTSSYDNHGQRHVNDNKLDLRVAEVMRGALPNEITSGAELIRQLFNTFRPQGIGSKRYFDRYFSYGVAPTDISDAEMSELLSSLETTADAVDQQLQRLASRNPSRLLEMLSAINLDRDTLYLKAVDSHVKREPSHWAPANRWPH